MQLTPPQSRSPFQAPFPYSPLRTVSGVRVAPAGTPPDRDIDSNAPTAGSDEGDGLDLTRLGDLQQRVEDLLARLESGGAERGHHGHGHHEHEHDRRHDHGGEHGHGHHGHHGSRGARRIVGRIDDAVRSELRAIGEEMGVLGPGTSDGEEALRSLARDFREGIRDDWRAAKEDGHHGRVDRVDLAEAIRGRFATLVDGLRSLGAGSADQPAAPEGPDVAEALPAEEPAADGQGPTATIGVRIAISIYAELSFDLSGAGSNFQASA